MLWRQGHISSQRALFSSHHCLVLGLFAGVPYCRFGSSEQLSGCLKHMHRNDHHWSNSSARLGNGMAESPTHKFCCYGNSNCSNPRSSVLTIEFYGKTTSCPLESKKWLCTMGRNQGRVATPPHPHSDLKAPPINFVAMEMIDNPNHTPMSGQQCANTTPKVTHLKQTPKTTLQDLPLDVYRMQSNCQE